MARCTFAGVPAILLFLFQLASDDFTFVDPRPVTITGYSGDAMEPFLTPDGRYLLFNNSNADPARTDLQWAERIDDVTFAYRGTLSGANSTALDAVASIDSDGAMYFISTRDPALATVYRATFDTESSAMWCRSPLSPRPVISSSMPASARMGQRCT